MAGRDIVREVGVRAGIVPIYATTNHATTASEVNAVGYSRAMWIIQTGAMNATAVLTMKVQNSTASGGTFSDVTSAALVNATNASASKVFLIDHAINASYPYLKLKGTSGTARAYVAATVVLYGKNGLVRDTVTAAQVIDL